jgi:hypothetical protein
MIRMVNVIDFKPLVSHNCRFESRQGLWIFHVRMLAHVGSSTPVPVCVRNNVHRDTRGIHPSVKLESPLMICTALVPRNSQTLREKVC